MYSNVYDFKKKLAVLLIYSVLGPYLGPVRFDLVIVAIISVTLLLKISHNMEKASVLLSFIYFCAFVCVLVSDSIIGPEVRQASYVSVFSRLGYPVLIFIVTSVLVSGFNKEDVRRLFNTIITCGVISSLVSMISSMGFDGFLEKYYARGGESGIWRQARSLGRYTGVFNQPLEAGVFFSLVLMLIIYLWSTNAIKKEKALILSLVIFVGGVLSLSKVFIVVGLICTFLIVLFIKGLGVILKLLPIFSVLILLILFLVQRNASADYLSFYLKPNDSYNFIMKITAGRFGSSSSGVSNMFIEVFNNSPIFGFGMGTQLPIDNAFLEYYFQGGFLALLFYIAAIIYMAVVGLSFWNSSEGKCLLVIAIFISLSGVGGPVVTANRAGIICMICISLFMQKIFNVEKMQK